jgi:hypothetical protein
VQAPDEIVKTLSRHADVSSTDLTPRQTTTLLQGSSKRDQVFHNASGFFGRTDHLRDGALNLPIEPTFALPAAN